MPPLDDADKTFLAKAIADALKANNEQQAGEIGKAIDGKLKPVTERLETIEKKPADDKGKGKDDDKGKGGKDKEAADPEVAELKKRLDQSELERKAEADKRITEERRNAARAALVDAGMPADRVKHALTFLESEGLIATDEKTGVHGFRGKDKYGAPLIIAGKEGAAAWLGTDDGKAYLPAKAVNGTGDTAGGRQGDRTSTAPRTEKGGLDWGALGTKVADGIVTLEID
jgi:hypothetical protein